MAVEEAGDLADAALVWLGVKAGSTGPDVAAAPAVAAAVAGFVDSLPGVVPEFWTPAQLQGAVMLTARIIRRRNSLSGVEAFSGDVALPGLGPVAGVWRDALGPAVEEAVGSGLLMDLRSTMYAAFWRPPATSPIRVATVRVLHEHHGVRKVVSHFNKATKGRIVRDLLEDGANPRTPQALAKALEALGWEVEVGEPTPRGTQLDVVVREV